MQKAIFKQMTDEQLVLLFQYEQDGLAFGELYCRYFTKLYHYCHAILNNAEEAADIAQDTFAKAAEKIHHLKSPAQFSAWLFRIGRNACIDQAKEKQRHQAVSPEGAGQMAEEEFDVEEAMARDAIIEQISLLMGQLSPEARSILTAKYFDGRSIQELTELMGLSESAIKMRLSRARHRILKLYNRPPRIAS